jgi:osmoprotectant transport system substrate-binding protein
MGTWGAALALVLTGCGEEGSSGTSSPPAAQPSSTGGGGEACVTDVSGTDLVVLEDDKKLQTVDNIIPAVNADAASQPMLDALNKVSAEMTTEELIELNRQVVVERQTSPNVAKDYVESEGLTEGLAGGSGDVVIGAANFAENQTLAEVYRIVLEAAGFNASTQTLGNREIFEPALERGEIQVIPEYVGTLAEFLNKRANGADAEAVASGDLEATVTELTRLGEAAGLVFGEPSEAADQNAFAVTREFAEANDVSTLSELSEKCGNAGLVLGGPPECPERPFCQPGLESTYGLTFASFTALDAGGPLTQTALRQGQIQVGLVLSSDGALAGTAG